MASTTIPADAGNFSIIDARVVREIVALGESDRYLPGLRSWVGFKQRGIEIRREPRYDDKPRVAAVGLWRLAKTAIFSFSSLPLTAVLHHRLRRPGLVPGPGRLRPVLQNADRPGHSRLDLQRAGGQLFRRRERPGHLHPGRIRDPHLRPGPRPADCTSSSETRNLHPAADSAWPDRRTPGWSDRRVG